MKKRHLITSSLLSIALLPLPAAAETLAFGSCMREWNEQPVWHGVSTTSPSAFVFMGDNVYADNKRYTADDPSQNYAAAYRALASNKDFQHFHRDLMSRGGAFLGTWDDHDYGENDGGATFANKVIAKRAFNEFFTDHGMVTEGLIADASRNGVYSAHLVNLGDYTANVILLDTRSFRGPMTRVAKAGCPIGGDHIVPKGATMLGDAQWLWLEQELQKPADIRIVVSSIQLLSAEHCFEKWSNFPWERQRFIDLIADNDIPGVVILSGDRHLSEISVLNDKRMRYPLYEVTSSGMNSAMGVDKPHSEANALRALDDYVTADGFGTLSIDAGEVTLALRDVEGKVLQQVKLPLKSMQ